MRWRPRSRTVPASRPCRPLPYGSIDTESFRCSCEFSAGFFRKSLAGKVDHVGRVQLGQSGRIDALDGVIDSLLDAGALSLRDTRVHARVEHANLVSCGIDAAIQNLRARRLRNIEIGIADPAS